ncbi:MAG TPA: glycosyltransferase family 2 protein [Pyrinomonadaceae bacterium]|nr:glycosyltransferase family 2 protein [Pyrinomonadaceae bacterium]
MLDQITPLILTYNEESNLERTMNQLSWASDIVVVDSFSDDDTTKIASGFPQARIFQREFDSHQCQWMFGLTKTDIRTPWVLALDADYILTDELISELRNLQPEAGVNGYTAEFVYCLNGKRLRSGIYPPVSVLYRVTEAAYEQDGHTHRVSIRGEVRPLRSKILHDDRKPLRRWLLSQVNYAQLEAQKLQTSAPGNLTFFDRIRRWRIVAPVGMLFYCLVLRGGLFDGRAGLFYAFQRTLAEIMLSLHLLDAIGNRKESSHR